MAQKPVFIRPTMGPGAAARRAVVARASMDIENLLIWAYQKQLVGALDGGGVGLHEVERLASGIEWTGSSADGVATIQRIAALGCRVDGGGYVSGDVHEDAETLHQAVIALGDDLDTGLVIMCARAGRRPEWFPGKKAEQVIDRDPRGRAVPLRDGSDNAIPGKYRMRWTVRPEVLDGWRVLYTRWWDALDVLAKALPGRLAKHAVTGPAAPAKPWLEE
jgi:hypothetical protein